MFIWVVKKKRFKVGIPDIWKKETKTKKIDKSRVIDIWSFYVVINLSHVIDNNWRPFLHLIVSF